jgi:hypothetical protein
LTNEWDRKWKSICSAQPLYGAAKEKTHLALESLEGHPAEIAAAAARLLRRDAPPLRRPQADIAALPRLASGREQETCRGTWARVTIDRFRHIGHFNP